MTTHRRKKHGYDLHQDIEIIKKAVMGVSHNVKGQASQVKDDMAHYIAYQPFKSVGVAVLTGLVFGLILKK